MIMKRIALIFLGSLLIAQAFNTYAQERKEPLVRDGIYERETIPQRIPIPYPHLREADMLWTKRIWRVIDLGEKMNHPLYYPTTRMHDRVSLVQRLMDAVKFNEINAYGIEDDEFTSLMSYNQILVSLDAIDEERVIRNPLTGLDTTIIVPGSIPWHQIKQLLIKEEWFFDRQHSTMHVRILGICPIRVYVRTLVTGDEDLDIGGDVSRVQLFWVYYPHARSVLANTAVFNDFNDAQRISFDDLFFKRRFSSYIVRESNVYDNRRIPEYTFGGIPNMQESERIKNDLFLFEHDLWEY
jgi:gliding motility associated protien GldN